MLTSKIEIPVFDDLKLDLESPVARGAVRTVVIIQRRTRAGRAVDGSPLPQPQPSSSGRRRALDRTGELVGAVRVIRVRKKLAVVGVEGVRSDGRPQALVLNAMQAGAVGGRAAGARAPVEMIGLSDEEAAEVEAVMAGDVVDQVDAAEANGSVFEFHTETVEGPR